MPKDCTRCGACCFSESDRHARVTGDDYERLGDDAARLVVFLGNQAFMRLVRMDDVAGGTARVGHCAALVVDPSAGTFLCSVYDRRPDVCRDLDRGSPACAGERFVKGDRPERLVQLIVGRPSEARS
jgi:Fe-S-cluster containining protein